ncbi:MAG: hypothetical protein WD844_16280 [Thermoleophilaceae bacterium]
MSRRAAQERPSWPQPGTSCTYRGGGCQEPALEARWVCHRHAARLEAVAAEIRRYGPRRAA